MSRVIFYNPIMDADVAQRLIALNKAFYQNLAEPFSATRGRLQPGVLRILEDIPGEANILDLGCGNGGVARELARRSHKGRYVGVDASTELIKLAGLKIEGLKASFVQTDLTSEDWILKPPISNLNFDLIFALAVLHHLPSREVQLSFLRQVGSLLARNGRFVLSNWQFLNNLKLKARIQPWDKIGLSDEQVDEGDYLLDWRSGGEGLRYVHHFDTEELEALAKETGFRVLDSFLSDGKSGNLALYQVWETSKL